MSQVVCGPARFTVLTPRIVRCEYSTGAFEDRPTLSVCNRELEPPAYEAHKTDKGLELKTAALSLTYTDTGKPFHRGNLRGTLRTGERWQAGVRDRQNLGGTLRTLDAMDGSEQVFAIRDQDGQWLPRKGRRTVHLEEGLLSRRGWTVFDDSGSPVLDAGGWVTARAREHRQDLYLLAHGLDYQGFLSEAARVFGTQPLPPRYAFGYWYSKYWAYTDTELEHLVESFDTMNVPLDVLVIDMDWHLPGWTGYTWDRDYFPDPGDTLRRLKDRGVKVTLNLHPADGVAQHEEVFPEVARRVPDRVQSADLPRNWLNLCRLAGRPPEEFRYVPFDATDREVMKCYFELLLRPHEAMGVDFWWLDWQQGTRTAIEGLDPLPWLNHLHWQDAAEVDPGRRPLCFSRYGGLGAGRYPVGFSGDTYCTWKSLAFQPHFTATAANVLYGYWSHDIGGHIWDDPLDPELYTRWMQFGVYSPVLRTHSTKSPAAERRFWEFPEPFGPLMMECVRRRYALVPYLYTQARRAFDTGVSLLRPMYYHWPEHDEAYRARDQYMFGDDLLVAPVTAPCDEASEMAGVRVWLPSGNWIDTARGLHLEGGRWLDAGYMLAEIPVFVRPGTVIWGQRPERRLNPGGYLRLTVTVYPGASGTGWLYEDDGVSCDYLQGAQVHLGCDHDWSPTRHRLRIGPFRGSYRGFTPQRELELRLPMVRPPSNVSRGAWSYHGPSATLLVNLGKVDLSSSLDVVVEYGSGNHAPADGLAGLMTRLARVQHYCGLASPPHPRHAEERLAVRLAQTGNRLSRRPQRFDAELAELRVQLRRLPRVLTELRESYLGDTDQLRLGKGQEEFLRRALAILSGGL